MVFIFLLIYFRHDSGGSIFIRRMDYSSFNVLPKQKINSYHIKMEDECSIGNDETRIFILSNLASNKMNKVPCVLCKQYLTVFDRYPLIDGTFFLSPRQHNRTCVQVNFFNIRPNFCAILVHKIQKLLLIYSWCS